MGECGVVSLFPRSRTRHSGYNAGVGGAIGKRGGSGSTNRWQTVRINARADGYVDFYLNGSRRYRVKDNRYRSGKVRVGFGCRNYRFRNLRVTQGRNIKVTNKLLSRGKPTYQGGWGGGRSEGWSGRPSRAVDGRTDGRYGKGTCTHTQNK